ncbi:MAG: 4-(cytidine 5'-diphospho)-2-C-methyl-D-erythritol kinase [SAR202 cluster bacterium]|nr:4-(cytidine 5'-diphospho)-2-C-methyl-D-erythritol kinase [SAR202 cluster bacterium]
MFNLLSPAKLNLSLEVNSLLDNGFHNLTSIMHTLHLHDEISISYSKNTKTVFIPSTVEDSNNSILDAVHLFQQEFHIQDQVEIVTTKNIPTSSGLGGGSSNSTAVLKELIKINKLEVELSKQRELAFQLSSDSPFFVSGGCSLVEGQGEKITTGLGISNLWSVIFTPLNIEISNKTRFMYSLLSKQHYSDGSITTEIFNSINQPNSDLLQLLSNTVNTFEQVIDQAFLEYKYLKDKLLSLGVSFVRLSGSGPSFYTIVDNLDYARNIATKMKSNNLRIITSELQ